MPQNIGIAQAVLEVNNQKVPYNANSLTMNPGKPMVDVKSVNDGGSFNLVHTTDAESGVASIKFTMRSTQDIFQVVNGWRGIANNTVRISDKNGFTVVMTEASMVTPAEYSTGTDGSVEIEFKGKGPDDGVAPADVPAPLAGIFT